MDLANHKPELLAPAGGWEQLFYALHFGADAVYVAADRFGLRSRAQNFALDELPAVAQQVHAAGARVYVTLNAYAHDEDIALLPRYVRAIEAAGIDAVIASDLGVISMVRETAPNLAIHVSTQASVSNAAAARAFHALGATRVVLARELSLDQIAHLRQELPPDLQLEAFVHGAMCMAISGRCLISDFLADRHANRGECVQPCRWAYELREPSRPDQSFPIVEEGGLTHIMNSKDLNMLDHLDALAAAGVDSVKIEGRVKKAFYVATVVNAYRHVLDGEDPAAWQPELDTISHRPYSTGFYFGPASQLTHDDVYVQRYDWVAEAASCEPTSSVNANGAFRCQVRCRNRFYEGDELQVLSPSEPVRAFRVTKLHERFEDNDGQVAKVPVKVANKAMGSYEIETPFALRPRDILRVKRRNPSCKN